MRFFNTAGPIKPDIHYYVPSLERIDLDEVLLLIEQQRYFVLHAPRQTGKTSVLLALMDELNASGRYRCMYVNVEIGQSAREDVGAAIRAILGQLALRAERILGERIVKKVWREALEDSGPHGALQEVLSHWAAADDDRPLVLMIDEIDALIGDTLLSVLRQLRAGYPDRPRQYPQTVILCGVRDVRDYRIQSTAENAIVAGGSAFNIRAESVRLDDFTRDEVQMLLAQHTEATGQAFEEDAWKTVWELTQGQPWLVNALAYEACFKNKAGRDRSRPVTAAAICDAREQLILRRETHLDQLTDKLQEERVRRVVEPLLSGVESTEALPQDDVEYVRDLGILRREGSIAIANPIYQEVIPRDLTYTTQVYLAQDPAWYVDADGRLRLSDLLTAFQEFFREHSEHWVDRFQYREAGPQLLLQAFLQRIVNSGGRIEREYGLGRMRTDLLILWPAPGDVRSGQAVQKAVVECKLLYKSLEQTVRDGLEQTRAHMDRCAAEEGHLVVFNRTAGVSWNDRIFRREEETEDAKITVWGM
ncbi:MAG: ATP-binding protein [Gemmatimonadota bacterium]|nr:ATP-binding protein [Gemmatimonadota bacterium]